MNTSLTQQTIHRAGALDIFLMCLTSIIWAAAFVAIKVAVPEVGPLWLAAIRVVVGMLVLAPYAIWKGIVFPKNRTTWILLTLMSVFNIVIPFFLIAWAEKTIDSGVVALLMGTGPFLALIGTHFSTTDDRITWHKSLAVLLGFTGVLMIIGVDALQGIGNANLTAQLATLAGSACYVIAGLMVRRIDIPPTRLAFLALVIGGIILTITASLVDGAPNLDLSPKAFWSLAFLGVFSTGIAYVLRFMLIRRVGYSTFALSINMIPVLGVILGAVILGETITFRTMIALALVLAGLFVARLGTTAPPAAKKQAKQ